MRRPRDYWPQCVFRTRGAAWVRTRRPFAGSAAVFGGRTGTPPGRGDMPRWGEAVLSWQGGARVSAPRAAAPDRTPAGCYRHWKKTAHGRKHLATLGN